MIPLSVLLIAWCILAGICALMTLITVLQMLRLGISGPGTFVTSLIFIAVAGFVVLGSSAYFTTVDWTQSVPINSSINFMFSTQTTPQL